MNDIIQFVSLITAVCGIPFVPALWRWYMNYRRNSLTQSMEKVNEPLVDAYKKQLKGIEAEMDTLKNSQVADLHDKIYREGNKLLEKDDLTVDQLDNFDHLYRAYSNLGGNGTGEAMYNRVMQLPLAATKSKSLVAEAREIHEEREKGDLYEDD